MVKKKRQSDAHDGGDSSTDSSDERPLQSPTTIATNGGCQHVKRAVDTQRLRKQLKLTGLASDCTQCGKGGTATDSATTATTTGVVSPAAEANEEMDNLGFEYDNTLWLCLKCGTQLCGRSKNQHALQHYKTPHSDSHALTMNTRSFEIWCYDCNNEVTANSRKNLLECVEVVKKLAQKPPQPPTPTTLINNITQGLAQVNAVNHMVTPPSLIPTPPALPPIPGMAKRVNDNLINLAPATAISNSIIPLGPPLKPLSLNLNLEPNQQHLPRVRGLTNLGNTCFFNAVMQCLAQTPYLLDVLKESSEPGEKFILPGGTFKFKDNDNVELPMIEGTLSGWGGLTAALAQALEELQTGGGVFTPGKLFDKLCNKCPQFRGGDQHDSHELLRHLLESVRSEDLKRYQRVILQNLGYKDQDINSVTEEMRQKCKIYGNQAADRILRPEQVFRGFLVSTLTCQDCFNVSSRHEYFLDMSLPVSVEKPQPPQRHKTSPDNSLTSSGAIPSFYLNPAPAGPTKAQLKKEKEKERKAKRAAKHKNQKMAQKLILEDITGAAGDAVTGGGDAGDCVTTTTTTPSMPIIDCPTRLIEFPLPRSSSASSDEESDADVEDNLIDDNATSGPPPPLIYDANGNDTLLSPNGKPEKRDDSPENMDKDSLDEDENDSGIATSPANGGSFPTSSTGGDTNDPSASDLNSVTNSSTVTVTTNSLVSVGLSEKGANLVRQLSLSNDIKVTPAPSDSGAASISTQILTNGNSDEPTTTTNEQNQMRQTAQALTMKLDQMQIDNEMQQKATARKRAQRQRTQSYSDWSTTIAPRYQCEDGECSIQSCLNNFTGVELMTGNNKVGCENCTKRINGNDPKAKTINTNATKQFLISSPPAVLILHLKRFQLGPRCMFRKLTRGVSFNTILDIAPFCGSKVKNLPNIDRKQKKLLYALYGVVEHSGGMYGGHYTAYVKVRAKLASDDPRWKFIPQGSKAELEQDDEQRKKLDELLAKEKARELRLKAADDSDDFSNGSTTTTSSSTSSTSSDDDDGEHSQHSAAKPDEAANVQVPSGKWYYVSDSLVREVNEEEVLRAQAYLLFYERIY